MIHDMPVYKILIRDDLNMEVKARLKIKSKLKITEVKERIKKNFETSPDTRP